MHITWLFLLLSGLFQSAPLHPISLLNGKIEMMVPDTLAPISDEMFRLKYRGAPRPPLVLSDQDGEINLICMPTESKATESQMDKFKDFTLAEIQKRRPDLKILSKGVRLVHGKKVGYFKFISDAIDQKVFNYYFMAIVDGKVVLFSFNCIEKLQPAWEPTAEQVVESLRIK